jgi:hypothetical protein
MTNYLSGASVTRVPASGSSASLVWAISFGDLLTLLVCFFLVLTPWEKLHLQEKSEQDQRIVAPPHTMELLGINLAPFQQDPLSLEQPVTVLLERGRIGGKDRRIRLIGETPIFPSQVSFDSMQGIEELRKALMREVKPLADLATTVAIRVCDPNVDVVRIAGLTERMVDELGIGAERRVLSVSASGCDKADIMRPVSDVVVGAVTVLKELPVASAG